jgi:hypothetical protein
MARSESRNDSGLRLQCCAQFRGQATTAGRSLRPVFSFREKDISSVHERTRMKSFGLMGRGCVGVEPQATQPASKPRLKLRAQRRGSGAASSLAA